jgi:large subunit ribosomal protein L25
MAQDSKLIAEIREDSGSSAARRLRADGKLPASINKTDNTVQSLELNTHDFERMLHHHSSEHLVLDLEIAGKRAKVLLKEVQHHPVSDLPLHASFIEISMTEKMTVPVSITLIGEAAGVLQEGGVLEHLLREVEIECLPDDLVETIEIDVSALMIGDSLSVKDLVPGSKISILTDGEIGVAQVSAPRVEEEPDEAAAEGEVALAEGEEAPEGEAKAEGADAPAKADASSGGE